ncbi:hypothetical protein OG500_11075 [Kitasatospora sp. NBC_01250]|uniref:hypothetical protein n=1 Tax=Kitasatospora sp. NBC_01250 TaxID=2903571 RepID=UPI002E3349E7|nr:hypothetical protein [Kitasatospora sp. NBC_01250]
MRVTVESLLAGSVRTIEADAVVYATGYRPSDPLWLLEGLISECKRDEEGRPNVARDYRIVTSDSVCCGIYLQGASTEHRALARPVGRSPVQHRGPLRRDRRLPA